MTADKIYGDSIEPQKFLNNLTKWRSSLSDPTSPKLSAMSEFRVNTAVGADYGKLVLNMQDTVYQIVHTSPIPIVVTQYLEIRFRVRQLSAGLVKARIIAQALDRSGDLASLATTHGPVFQLEPNRTIEVSAIIGSGKRDGVDLAWGLNFKSLIPGIEILGAAGNELVFDELEIIDATGHFIATNSDWVDIRDFGAIGDGKFDNHAALLAADAEANGRAIFIPRGKYFVGDDITILSPIRAYGSLTASDQTAVMLADSYNYDSYLHTFKNERIAFRKALQALYRFQNHTRLDLNGRSITLSEPVDMWKLINKGGSFFKPRTVHNGQISAGSSSAWDSKIVKSTASYDKSAPFKLTNVTNIDQIEIASLVQGTGVGREVYVSEIDINAKTLTLSGKVNRVAPSQEYTFKRFRFMLDYSGFDRISRQEFSNLDFECNFNASVLMFAKNGFANKFCHNWVREPKDRGLCSYANGCFGLTVESCFFISSEADISAKDRTSIAISTRDNDIKIRNNKGAYFRHFAYLDGCGHIIASNHFYQGNKTGTPDRTAGVVITYLDAKTTINGNYIDNSWIELCNEKTIYWGTPNSGGRIGDLVVVGNIFTANTVSKQFRWIVIAPYGNNHFIDGMAVTANTFYLTSDNIIERVDAVDESNGTVDRSRTRNLCFENNVFLNVINESHSHITREISRTTAATTWTESFADILPFGTQVLRCDGVVPLSNLSRNEIPKVALAQGTERNKLGLNFSAATSGKIMVRVGADLPN